MKYEKILITCFITLLFTGCITTRTGADSDIVSRDSQAVGRLEGTVTELDRTVNDSRERIGNIIETSRGIEDGIERLEYLFNEYEREVERLLDEIDRIRTEVESQSKTDNDGIRSSDFVHHRKDCITDSEAEV